jgi:hypothetical protein
MDSWQALEQAMLHLAKRIQHFERIGWPRDLPSSQTHDGDEERNLAGKVNTIFQSAIAWQLHDELAHA